MDWLSDWLANGQANWQLLALSFATVFLAELGDKSQLAAIALSGQSKSPTAVFLGTSVALVMASAIGVVVGGGAALVLPTAWVKGTAALGFAILGVRLLWPKSDRGSVTSRAKGS
ncbi:MAG: TMEM165/GDT1 family protein [Cyanobacteria bacterium P01_D01_bin.73]